VKRTQRVALAALGFLIFLAVWQLAPMLGFVSPSVLPPPSVLPRAFLRELNSGIWFSSLITSLQHYLPALAWVPFAILWFGIDPKAAIFIIGIGVFWISYFAALGAVRAVDRDLIELADAFGFRRADQKLVKVILPASAPGILAGLRTALGQAWMAVVAAEIFGVPGLGQRMMQASNLLASDIVVIYMATMAALYGILDTLFVAIQSRLLRWKE